MRILGRQEILHISEIFAEAGKISDTEDLPELTNLTPAQVHVISKMAILYAFMGRSENHSIPTQIAQHLRNQVERELVLNFSNATEAAAAVRYAGISSNSVLEEFNRIEKDIYSPD